MKAEAEVKTELAHVMDELKYYEQLNAREPSRALSRIIRDLQVKKGLLEHALE